MTDLNSVKAYRREVMDGVPLRPDWHRYMVVIAAADGFRLDSLPVPLYPRRAGESKFTWRRIPVGVFDLLSVWFQLRFGRKPMLFFGIAGAALFVIGLLAGIVALVLRFGYGFGFRPLLNLVETMVISGIVLVRLRPARRDGRGAAGGDAGGRPRARSTGQARPAGLIGAGRLPDPQLSPVARGSVRRVPRHARRGAGAPGRRSAGRRAERRRAGAARRSVDGVHVRRVRYASRRARDPRLPRHHGRPRSGRPADGGRWPGSGARFAARRSDEMAARRRPGPRALVGAGRAGGAARARRCVLTVHGTDAALLRGARAWRAALARPVFAARARS